MSNLSLDTLELQAILDTMAEGVFFLDADHIIRRWNRAMEAFTGFTADEAIGRSCGMLREGEACDGQGMGMVEHVLSREGRVDGEEVLIRRKDGARIPLLVQARVMQDVAGTPIGSVVTFTDLSRMRRLEAENQLLREEARERGALHNLVGQSVRMREIYRLIELAAASEETILVLGDTGTGKELVARAIHHLSPRKDAPLVTVNCSALSESLLESELFGHVKGAFTGAVRDYVGRIESAAGGTLFLDEIGELTPLVQVKLLRAIQERNIERVGESQSRKVDVRIIAATHRDLKRQVQTGAFRQDLYYRLNVFPIQVPLLAERREDIPPLLDHFIHQRNDQTGKAIHGFNAEAMRLLLNHPWPGNVRELENAVAHAFITCPGGTATPDDLPRELLESPPRSDRSDRSVGSTPPSTPPRLSRDLLLATLRETGYNKAETARRLNVDRTTVWRKMKGWNIEMSPEE